ncbi:MAG: hypothetical protein ACUVRV_04620 [Cyanobacteriota bacterium]
MVQSQFALYGFHTSNIKDEITPSLPQQLEHFVAGSRSFEDWQTQIRSAQLDVILWSGGNTTLEALPYELPIITLPGSLMRGRHTYAILQQLGIPDTIAHSLEDYVQIGQQVKARQDRVCRNLTPIHALEQGLQSLCT